MTTDNFDYYTDDQFEWTGILNYYQAPNFIHKKGTVFSVEVIVNKEIDESDSNLISGFSKGWTWGEDRRIKAFKMEDPIIVGDRIFLKFLTIRKSKRYDEIKYFLFDLGAFLDLSDYKIIEINVNEIL